MKNATLRADFEKINVWKEKTRVSIETRVEAERGQGKLEPISRCNAKRRKTLIVNNRRVCSIAK